MAELTKEQITQKLQRLQQLTEEAESLTKELAEAGAFEIPEGELDQVSGGLFTFAPRPRQPKLESGGCQFDDFLKQLIDLTQKKEKLLR